MREYWYKCPICEDIFVSHEMNLKGWCNRWSCRATLNKPLSDGKLSPVLMKHLFTRKLKVHLSEEWIPSNGPHSWLVFGNATVVTERIQAK